jgi:hypothetical protein
MPVACHRGDDHGAGVGGLQLDAALLVDAAAGSVDVGQLHASARHQPGEPAQHEAQPALGDLAPLRTLGVTGFEEHFHRITPSVEGRNER